MRFPAQVIERNGEWVAKFPGLPGCEARADTTGGIVSAAQAALDGWLAAELRSRRTPPHPPRRVRLWRRERLLWVPVTPEMAIPLLLRWSRIDAGLTQSDLAKRLGLTQPRIAQLELPGTRPAIDTLQRIAAALNQRLEVNFIPLPPQADASPRPR